MGGALIFQEKKIESPKLHAFSFKKNFRSKMFTAFIYSLFFNSIFRELLYRQGGDFLAFFFAILSLSYSMGDL